MLIIVPTSTSRTQAALASAMRVSVMRLARRLRVEREDDSLTLNQLSTMATLVVRGPLTVGELAAAERVQPPSMTRIVSGKLRLAPDTIDVEHVIDNASDVEFQCKLDSGAYTDCSSPRDCTSRKPFCCKARNSKPNFSKCRPRTWLT